MGGNFTADCMKAFDNTMLGTLIMAQVLRILHINNAFSILTGCSAEDLVNFDLGVLAGASYSRDFFRIMRATVAKKGIGKAG